MSHEREIARLREAIGDADTIVVGAGAGLSTAAGLTYAGERFERLFPDFIAKYGIRDMYSGGFFPFPSSEERWAWWSRHIWCNRYEPALKDTYGKLCAARRQGLLRHHHERRPPVPACGFPQGAPVLHAGRLRSLAVQRAMPR